MDYTNCGYGAWVGCEGDFAQFDVAHVVSLTFGGRDNPFIYLDTKLGNIFWEVYSCRNDPRHSGDDDEMDEDGVDTDGVEHVTGAVKDLDIKNGDDASIAMHLDYPQDAEQENDDKYSWKMSHQEKGFRGSAPTWTISGFFEDLKEQFRSRRWIPPNSVFVWDAQECCPEGMVPMLQATYRQHGWPDLEYYRRDECLVTVCGCCLFVRG
ncbi:hypothetical protein GE09DRAFT_1211424 [Coniochaeta sp. 2T2.1]|nr:hypothetical protein GE09DRAFT_1211424 [Coniochaeta sp. 2T2.1]